MNLFCFGLGYSAQHFIKTLWRKRSIRSPARRAAITPSRRSASRALQAISFDAERADAEIPAALAQTDVILVSVAPGVSVDPVLAKFGRRLAALPQKLKIIYLSTIGVYGDRNGEWVDEDRLPAPKSDRSIARVHAEKSWMALARDGHKIVHVLRLAGIYGPGRNALEAIRSGKAHCIVKKDRCSTASMSPISARRSRR